MTVASFWRYRFNEVNIKGLRQLINVTSFVISIITKEHFATAELPQSGERRSWWKGPGLVGQDGDLRGGREAGVDGGREERRARGAV